MPVSINYTANKLLRLKHQYVHLSINTEVATSVAQHYEKPVILIVKAQIMHEQGFAFYLSENGIWLTDRVPHNVIF